MAQESLNSFLKSAESLKIKGLTDEEDKSGRKQLSKCQLPEFRDEEKHELQDKSIKDDSVKTTLKESVKKEMQEISDRNENYEDGSNRDVVPLLDNESEEHVDDPDEDTGEVLDGAQGMTQLYIMVKSTLRSNLSNFRCRLS